jgi:hypothetical protein
MVFYYALHHSLPETPKFTGGKRNCATFLYGCLMYAIAHVVVMNLRLRLGECMDSLRSALFMVWLADCGSVGFLYKCHYGRSLLHEVSEVAGSYDEDQRDWVFDDTTHKYRRPDLADVARRESDAAARLAKEKGRLVEEEAERTRAERSIGIERKKREIRAAKVIQRWWRSVLYTPPDGIVYKRLLSSWSTPEEQRSSVPVL